MTAPATADVAPDTAVLEEPPTPSEETPESEVLTAPETDGEASPETDAGLDSRWEEMSPAERKAEFEKAVEEARKDAEAKTRESERRRHENELTQRDQQARDTAEREAAAAQRSQASEFRQRGAAQTFNGLLTEYKAAIENGEELGQEWVARANGMFKDMDRAAVIQIPEVQNQVLNAYLAEAMPGYRSDPALTEKYHRAYNRGDIAASSTVIFEMLTKAFEETRVPELKKQWQTEYEASLKTKAEEDAATERQEARSKAATPSGSGESPAKGLTRADIDKMTPQQYLKLISTPAGEAAANRALAGR